ncbi:MAG: glycosyltransferase family 2 protein, partial [Pseudomonadota bacterium]
PPLGIKNEDLASDPKLLPVEVGNDAWVDGRDALKVWALFGGRTDSARAPKTEQRLRLDALTDAVALENLLSDQLVPAIYGGGDLVAWAEIEKTERRNWIGQHADLSLKLGDSADLKAAWSYLITSDKQRLVPSLLDQLRLRGADFADAAYNLSRMATTRTNVLKAIKSNRLPQALLEAKRALLLGEPYARSLVDLVEEAMVCELDWPERLVVGYLVDRLKEVSPKPSPEHEIIELTVAEARTHQPENRDAHYLIRLSDYRLSDGVRALIGDVLHENPILPLRIVAAEGDVPADLLAFEPDPVGVLVSSFSDLSDAVSMLDNGRLPATFSLPVFAADEPPFCERAHSNPIILSFGEKPKKSLPAQFVHLKPGEVIGSALEKVSGTDATPVLISHPDLPITSEHLAIATSHYARFGEPPVLSLMRVNVSLLDRSVEVSPLTGSTAQVVSMVWLPMTVLSLQAARGLLLSLTEATEALIGAQTLMAPAGCSGRVTFAAGAEEKTSTKAEQVCKPLIARWIAGLREQNPPIAPNLPSLSSLRSLALQGPAAQRLTAESALDNCYRVLASVERLSSGRLEEAEADEIASSQSLEVLLAHGLHAELGESVIKLILGQREQVFADERTLRWALRAAGSCGMESKITHTLARSAPAIIAAYPDLLRQVFETLASTLSSHRIATVLLACIASSPASKTARFRHRVAEISRLYLEGPGARQVFAACGSDPHPQSVQAAFAVALSRDGSDFDRPLPPVEALQLAISNRDIKAITAVSRTFAENDTPLLDFLDLLRPFAKELAEMDLDETGLPFHQCQDDHEVALLALISGSETRMAALRQAENGEIGEELKAMMAASLCDSAAFIDHVNALGGDLGPKLAQVAPESTRWIFQAYNEAPSMEVEPSDGRVSVVMSSLDTDEDLIVPAVESVLAQSHEDLELLLIDDGSCRSHREALLEIAKRDPRIRAYTMPRNLGPYLCRNFALSVATGCFLAIQDAD